MNIMVFAPHPDDDILGCGGSIIHHVKKGHKVTVVYVTSGDAGSIDIPKKTLGGKREMEAKEGAEVLGVTKTIFLRFSDGYVEVDKEAMMAFVQLIRGEKPDVVYVPHVDDNHRDHRKTHELVVEAIRRVQSNAFPEGGQAPWEVKTVLAYEVWTPLSTFSLVADISDEMEKKLAAMKKHVSQLKNIAFDEAIAGLNRYRGAMTGKGKYAEVFQILTWDR